MNPTERRLAEGVLSRAETILREIDMPKGSPLQWVLGRAKKQAAEALAALIDSDASNVERVRDLQNDVRLYRLLVDFIRETIADAEDAHQALEAEDRDELLATMSEAAMAAAYVEGE